MRRCETRIRNVKQAEYEVLKTILNDERIQEVLKHRLSACCPKKHTKAGKVSVARSNKALGNLSDIFSRMKHKRAHFLPPAHIDYRGDD